MCANYECSIFDVRPIGELEAVFSLAAIRRADIFMMCAIGAAIAIDIVTAVAVALTASRVVGRK